MLDFLRNNFLLTLTLFAVCGCKTENESVTLDPSVNNVRGLATDKELGSDTGIEPADQRSPPILLEEAAADCGLDFQYANGEEAGNMSILESLGGGLAAIDFDRDGYDDFCIAGGGAFTSTKMIHGAATGLFRNMRSQKLQAAAAEAGIGNSRFYSHGVFSTDVDCDGFSDFLLTGYGGLQLYLNLGDGTFELTDSDATGLSETLWSSSAAWGDLDGDGFPDLFVAHYVDWSFQNDPFCNGPEGNQREICPPRSFNGLPDSLYINQGDGHFLNTSASSGLKEEGKGLGVVITDLDNDGDNDVYVTNDTVANHLYQNDGQANLQDASLLSGTALSDRGVPDGSMGVDIADFDSDGRADIWVVNYERETSALYQNSGNMVFRHISQRAGINSVGGLYVGWGTCCQDFDLDGDEDIFVSNGHVIRYPVNAPLKQRPLLLNNQAPDESGSVRFSNVSDSAGDYFQTSHMGRGAVAADFDNDGDVDLVVSRTNQPAVLLLNKTLRPQNWIQFELTGIISARQPVGTRVVVQTQSGQQMRIVKNGGSYASTGSSRLFFGLGSESIVDQVDIYWPSGQHKVLRNIPGRFIYHIAETDDVPRPIPN